MRASRICKIFVTAAILPWAAAGSAQAALAIRNAPTKNVSCSAGVCTATAGAAVMNAGDLTGMLASSDVTLVSGNQAKDIKVETAFSWASSSRLTFDSDRSILVNRLVTVAGTGALTLTTNDGGTGGLLSFTSPGRIDFWDLSSSLVIDGASFTLLNTIGALSSDIAANPSGSYALAKDYDASVDGTYAHAAIVTPLSGTFEGLGHVISKLTIAVSGKNAKVGLFATLSNTGTLRDIGLSSASIASAGTRASLGGLVGSSGGTVLQCSVGGTITGTSAGGSLIGGLVGENLGTVSWSHSNAKVKGGVNSGGNILAIGGLVGVSNSGNISDSYATGTVMQTNTSYASYVGGLVGSSGGAILRSHASGTVQHAYAAGGLVGAEQGGTVSQSYATGSVSDAVVAGGLVGNSNSAIDGSYAAGNVWGNYAGGLVGENYGSIADSHGSGAVNGTVFAGGLVGVDSAFGGHGGSIARSFASGTVTGGDNVWAGGLAGYLGTDSLGSPGGTISLSFATGAVSGGNNANAGGLVGTTVAGTVENSYAGGAVSAGTNSRIGGLVGSNGFDSSDLGLIETSYSTGQVTGGAGSSIGGLLGYQTSNAGSVGGSYWDLDTSGISDPSQGAGNVANDPGITGLTDAQLKSGLPAGFDSSIWAESPSINGGLPYLIANPPP